MTLAPALVAGWYGKLPALGDFASRRLPPAFIGPWDAWLQRGIASSRATLGDRWLDVYLNGPLWNFALLPGVCGDSAWLGTIMPSVDKVGRHFPLTIALAVPPHAGILRTVASAREWFAAIDRAALACLDIHCLPEQLETRLAEVPFPALPAIDERAGDGLAAWLAARAAGTLVLHLPAGVSAADVLGAAARPGGVDGSCSADAADAAEAADGADAARAAGRSLWWSDTTTSAATRLLGFRGLPAADQFALLLDDADGPPP
ncbi:type VI secretion system-associated protein TagF [Pseudoduganella sp. SL102]|uniref:type VI secretion system-associated protein TagF n=1 Tax=Pseudoduganella sp. SL102 TaxID=2995154 RepID=UPI00248C5D0A|nr:type VI secretion system-associated protein TagF [Pseudoduganella sp. SL102]WBS00579.1 type VI secretion system-associated protein TagF [Pseudoduganella sp. SL102]